MMKMMRSSVTTSKALLFARRFHCAGHHRRHYGGHRIVATTLDSSKILINNNKDKGSTTNFLPVSTTTTTMLDLNSITTTTRNFATTTSGFSMSQLKDLRAMSGAPIVDCKKALGESNGDVDKAMDWLREHGAAKASKKVSGRDADEGLVACEVSDDGKSAALVKVSSETDFAGKSPAFVDFVRHVAKATLESSINNSSSGGTKIPEESVKTLEYESKSVQTALEDAIVAIRENLGIPSAMKLTTTTTTNDNNNGLLCSYVHGKVDGGTTNAGSAAAVVEIISTTNNKNDGDDNNIEKMKEAGKKLAMHIVAAKPSYLNPDSVPNDIIEKEKGILLSQLEDSKKPPEVIEKIVNGKMRKFFEENCLTEQEHLVEEKNPKVSKVLKSLGLQVIRYEYLAIGGSQ